MRAGTDLGALHRSLKRAEGSCDVSVRLRADPVGIVRRFSRPEEQELAGLLAACLAFGNVKAIRAGIEDALGRLGEDLCGKLDRPQEVREAFQGFRYRMVQGSDIAGVLIGARRVQRRHGTLGAGFAACLANAGDLRGALAGWVREIRVEGGLDGFTGARRGPAHVLPDPAKASGCKRLLLFLRWMVRPDDGIDLGVWAGLVSPSILQIPVDTHIHRLARNLGLTAAKAPSWRASEEITGVLRRIAPDDPVRYDFALCHLGMARACPDRWAPEVCGTCAIEASCVRVRRSRRIGRSGS